METFVVGAFMLATVKQMVDWLRYLKAGDWNGVVTQLGAWAFGFIVVFVVAHSDLAGVADFAGFTFDKLNIWSQVIAGVSVGSAASLTKDAIKASDNTDSAQVPKLLGERSTFR
jgi:hypothetical protein